MRSRTARAVAHVIADARHDRPTRCRRTSFARIRPHANRRASRIGSGDLLCRLVPGRHSWRIRREQFGVQPLQFTTGIHAKFVRDDLPCLRIRFKRLGSPTCPLQRTHQQRPQPLPQRVFRHQPAQLRDNSCCPAACEIRFHAQFGCLDPQLRHLVSLSLYQR
jgi:hypothetical protein